MNSDAPQNSDRRPIVQTINQAPEAVLLVDVNGVVDLANDAALALFGGDDKGLSGHALSSWFADGDAAAVSDAIARVLDDEPAGRLEEVTADFAEAPFRRIRLSIARMRHRAGLCVVANRIAGAAPPRPKMPRIAADDLAVSAPLPPAPSRREEPVLFTPPGEPSYPFSLAGGAGSPASPPRVRTAEELQHARPASVIDAADHHTLRRFEPQKPAPAAAPEAREPASTPVAPGRRDIYAEFESVRDRREREHEIPEIAPGKCLMEALRRQRRFADSESVTLANAVDDGGMTVPLDDEMLTAIFERLIERQVAVTPLYCEARTTLARNGADGFLARFVDIGRGLAENELDALFRQPDLALGISHTRLVEARTIAAKLGLSFRIETAVDGGTTIEIGYQR